MLVKGFDHRTEWYLNRAQKSMPPFQYEQLSKLYHRFRPYFVFKIAPSILIFDKNIGNKPKIKVEKPVSIDNTNPLSDKEIENSNLKFLGFYLFFNLKKREK